MDQGRQLRFLVVRPFLAAYCFLASSPIAFAFLSPQHSCSNALLLNHPQKRSTYITNPAELERFRPAQATKVNEIENENQRIASPSSTNIVTLPAFELWLLQSFRRSYDKALKIPCPFFRRRISDAMDSIDMMIRFLWIRHKSLPINLEPFAWRCKGDTVPKHFGISIDELADVIRNDWQMQSDKGYYITGRLSHAVYRDDCIFDGPDPDMPVRGLRKYLSAASHLFDASSSTAELLDLQIVRHNDNNITNAASVIIVQWRLNGVLRLPWRPKLQELTGCTYYYTDSNGLVYRHIEKWEQSVLEAFMGTFWPPIKSKIESLLTA